MARKRKRMDFSRLQTMSPEEIRGLKDLTVRPSWYNNAGLFMVTSVLFTAVSWQEDVGSRTACFIIAILSLSLTLFSVGFTYYVAGDNTQELSALQDRFEFVEFMQPALQQSHRTYLHRRWQGSISLIREVRMKVYAVESGDKNETTNP